jgi:hypothetical protein
LAEIRRLRAKNCAFSLHCAMKNSIYYRPFPTFEGMRVRFPMRGENRSR